MVLVILILILSSLGVALSFFVSGNKASRVFFRVSSFVELLISLALYGFTNGPVNIISSGKFDALIFNTIKLTNLSSILILLVSILYFAIIFVLPNRFFNNLFLRQVCWTKLFFQLIFLVRNPVVLGVLVATSTLLVLQSLRAQQKIKLYRVLALYLGSSAIFFLVGAVLWSSRFYFDANSMQSKTLDVVGGGLILLAILIRKGIFPFHSWIPAVFDGDNFLASVFFCTPQVAAYLAAVVLFPYAPNYVLSLLSVLSLFTAVYGAALGLVEDNPRRAYGFLFLSQSALVLTGLELQSVLGLASGMAIWISSSLSLGGFGICLAALESRRGLLSLSKFNGGFERMPALAGLFLALGLSCVGFPGSFSFVAHELLVDAAVEKNVYLGFVMLVVLSCNSLLVVKMFFSLFCGKDDSELQMNLGLRQKFALVSVVTLLLVLGVFPNLLVMPLEQASRELLKLDLVR